jgi:hypothetical protein
MWALKTLIFRQILRKSKQKDIEGSIGRRDSKQEERSGESSPAEAVPIPVKHLIKSFCYKIKGSRLAEILLFFNVLCN